MKLSNQSRIDLGELLKQIRLENKMSQGDLAKALDYMSNQYVSNVERGICEPTPRHLRYIYCELADAKKSILTKITDIYVKSLKETLYGTD